LILSRSALIAAILYVFATFAIQACAQSGTSSALAGTIEDPSGAVLPDAVVTITDTSTGASRKLHTGPDGHYLFAQVNPARYRIEVEAPGFAPAEASVGVAVGATAATNFKLQLGSNSQVVEVSAQPDLASLDNPNTSATLEAKAINDLPNPGQDLTYLAQFAQGALINTAGSSNDFKAAGGFGNVEFNGLPATSNGYILDGYDANDPFLGLNVGLSTNLVIGLNAVQEATVNTNSFAVDQGRYGASQTNYFTKSGTNKFHGNLYEIWNGSVLNAENYFLHATGDARKPRSNVNDFGGSIGGPIVKNKLFFFFDYEGYRLAIPLVAHTVVPSPAYQQYVLAQLPLGGLDPINGTALPAEPAEAPFYRNMFKLYRDTSGTPVNVLECPLDARGAILTEALPNGNGCANRRTDSLGNTDSENLIVLKIDHTINAKGSVWYRFQQDDGLQAAYTDAINRMFNAYSPQPQRTLVAGYTHLFSPNLVNQFNPGASWYSSIFEPNDYASVLSAFPIVLQGSGSNAPFTTLGGD